MRYSHWIMNLDAATAVVIFACAVITIFNHGSFDVKGRTAYYILLASLFAGNIAHILEIRSGDGAEKYWAFRIQLVLVLLSFVLTVAYIKNSRMYSKPPRRWAKAAVAAGLLITLPLLILNPGGGVLAGYRIPESDADYLAGSAEYGWLYILMLAVVYMALAAYTALLWRDCVKKRIPCRCGMLLGAAAVVMAGAHVLFMCGIAHFAFAATAIMACILTYDQMYNGVLGAVPYVKNNIMTLFGSPMIITLPDGRIQYVNPAAESFFRLPMKEMCGRSLRDIHRGFTQMRSGEKCEVSLCERPLSVVEVHATPLGTGGKSYGQLVILRDITKQKQADMRLHMLTAFDDITGLINRNTFLSLLERYQASRPDGLRGECLIAVAIDNANELRGIATSGQHASLRNQIARYIQKAVPASCVLAQFGETEFYIFSNGVPIDRDKVLEAYMRRKQHMFVVEMLTFHISFCAGIYYIGGGVSSGQAVSNVSYSVQHALRTSKEYVFYDDQLAQLHELQKRMLTMLEILDYQKDFYLEFQPIIDIRKNRVRGAEALLRWNHPVYGNLPPEMFIPIFENANEMDKLGLVIIAKACDALAGWAKQLSDDFILSINISKKQIDNINFIRELQELVESKRIPPGRLEFEITETATSRSVKNIAGFCRCAKQMGARVSLDDFGSGDTSVAHITDLELDTIKFAFNLSKNAHISPRRRTVIRSLLEMCARLGIEVVVEHVESAGELDILQADGFSLVQGFIFSRSLSENAFLEYYRRFSQDSAVGQPG